MTMTTSSNKLKICIGGRGALGLWVARHAVEAGHEVVFESEEGGPGSDIASSSNLGWLLGGSYAAFLHVILLARARRNNIWSIDHATDLLAAHKKFFGELRDGSQLWLEAAGSIFDEVPVFYRLPQQTWEMYQDVADPQDSDFVNDVLRISTPTLTSDGAPAADVRLGPFVVLRAMKNEYVRKANVTWQDVFESLVTSEQTLAAMDGCKNFQATGRKHYSSNEKYEYHEYGICRHTPLENRAWLIGDDGGFGECIEVVSPSPDEWHAFRRHSLGETLTVVSRGRDSTFSKAETARDWFDEPSGCTLRSCWKFHRRNPLNLGATADRFDISLDGLTGHTEFMSMAPVVARTMVERAGVVDVTSLANGSGLK